MAVVFPVGVEDKMICFSQRCSCTNGEKKTSQVSVHGEVKLLSGSCSHLTPSQTTATTHPSAGSHVERSLCHYMH